MGIGYEELIEAGLVSRGSSILADTYYYATTEAMPEKGYYCPRSGIKIHAFPGTEFWKEDEQKGYESVSLAGGGPGIGIHDDGSGPGPELTKESLVAWLKSFDWYKGKRADANDL
jgi:hypothetical protein